jgi:hypothetical protein
VDRLPSHRCRALLSRVRGARMPPGLHGPSGHETEMVQPGRSPAGPHRAVGAVWPHALGPDGGGPTRAMGRRSTPRWGRHPRSKSRASLGTGARGSSGWYAGQSAVPRQSRGTTWGLVVSSIARSLGDSSNMKSTALKHLPGEESACHPDAPRMAKEPSPRPQQRAPRAVKTHELAALPQGQTVASSGAE